LLAQGVMSRAEATLSDALAAIRHIDYWQLLPVALRTMAHLAMRRGDPPAAARWYGAADGAMAALGLELPASRRGDHERAVATVREQLGNERFVAAWATGRADPAGLIAAALANRKSAAGEPKPIDEAAFFTSRQREVLRLMAQGRTDKEIADALFVSRRTASKHVSSILAKLEAPSRTAAVAIASQHGLI
jgi:DNA-binding CsgD family transcriptional regulator